MQEKGYFMQAMTRLEVERALQENPTVILPLGATEEYGHHLPTGTESIIAEGIARRVGERAKTLVAPVLNFGWVDWLSRYPGTICLTQETTTRLIGEIAENFVRHGARNLFFLNGHSGHVAASHVVARRLHQEYGVRCGAAEIYSLAPKLAGDLMETGEFAWGHGGEGPTSLVLALAPELVRMDRAEPDLPGTIHPEFQTLKSGLARFEEAEVNFFQHFDEFSRTGIIGDPTKASAEKGRELVERLTDYLSRVVQALSRDPER